MIRYALTCENGHEFESWFQSADAFDKLHDVGLVECAICGESDVRKKIMAPNISKSGTVRPDSLRDTAKTTAGERPGDAANADISGGPLSAPASVAEQALRELRSKIEANSENVGKNFVSEARKIHLGEAPERAIIGEARLDEAKSLADEGIDVTPLPFLSTRKTS